MLTSIKTDFRSSLVTFLVALPLCLGIALASQAPLASGLFAGIIGGLIVALVSGSQLSVSGPAAGLAVIVATGIAQLGDFKTFTAAVLLSGLFQIGFSLFKAGKLGNFFPSSVIKGMLSAIGLILILKQFPHAVGFDSTYMGSEEFQQTANENTFQAVLKAFNVFDLGCVIIALASFGIIASWDKLAGKSKNAVLKSIPSALLAVVGGILIAKFSKVGLEAHHYVALPFSGGVGDFFAAFALPNFAAFSNPQVWIVGLTIAIVGSLESLLSLDAADKIDPEKRISSKNRELLAQGIGNSLSGLIGGLPITAVIVRTSANINAGAKTKLSGMMHGAWLLLAVILIPNLMNLIPLSTLAVVLILVGYKLTKPELYISMYRKGFDQFVPFIVTIAAILFTDLLKGIAIGMVVGFFFVFKNNQHQSIVMVHDESDYLIRFMKDVSFLQKDRLREILTQIPDGANVTVDGSQDVFIDADIVELVEDFVVSAPQRNIHVEYKKSTTALSPLFKMIRVKEMA